MSEVWRLRDHYALLEVERNAQPAAIKAAYRLQLKAWHPDRHAEVDRAAVSARAQAVHDAFAVLGDPTRRRRYDLTLPEEFSGDTSGEWPEPVQNIPEAWKQLAVFLKDEDLGTSFIRRMAYSAGDYLERRRLLSPKQRPYAEQAWALGVDHGWKPEL